MKSLAKIKSKAEFFFWCLGKSLSRYHRRCPNCGQNQATIVDRKYLVTRLMRCHSCQLLFRVPTTSETENRTFYSSKYEQGFTTKLPSDRHLAYLLDHAFADTEKDYSGHADVLGALHLEPGAKIFDFGCSWGYGSYQLAQAGYDVAAYEISDFRREYARDKLSVTVVDDFEACLSDTNHIGRFDCFFSSHVLEHVPSPNKVFLAAHRLLKPEGLFVAFTPNGSVGYKTADFGMWRHAWGEVHPNLIDDQFYRNSFSNAQGFLSSSPYDCGVIAKLRFEKPGIRMLDLLAGAELLFVARKDRNREYWQPASQFPGCSQL